MGFFSNGKTGMGMDGNFLNNGKWMGPSFLQIGQHWYTHVFARSHVQVLDIISIIPRIKFPLALKNNLQIKTK